MFFFNFEYLIFISPALLVAFWAQMRVRSTYAQASQVPARLSGAAAARHILDAAGLQHAYWQRNDYLIGFKPTPVGVDNHALA